MDTAFCAILSAQLPVPTPAEAWDHLATCNRALAIARNVHAKQRRGGRYSFETEAHVHQLEKLQAYLGALERAVADARAQRPGA